MSVEYCLEIFDSGATWGPGTKLAECWDARNLGWSRYDRLSGKGFATLAQDASAIALLQGLKTHVRITRVAAANTEVFNGLLVDFDSTGDDVVLDLMDYTGLLGGSRCGYKTMYPTKKLGTEIVSPEWTLAKSATGSRLGFVETGTIEDPVGTNGTTVIKTNSTFGVTDQMRLQLLWDISEIGRANTTNHVTFEVTRTGTFAFNFWRNMGSARDIPLVLGGTVSDYRYLPGWRRFKNDIATIGTTVGGGATEIVKKDAASITALGLWQDVGMIKTVLGIDGNLAEADQQVAATGRMLVKMMQTQAAIAVRLETGTIEPFVGWDINDTMPVEIVNGIDSLTGYMRVLGARCVYDEAGEQVNLIVGPVVV